MALLIRQNVVGHPVDAPQTLDPRRKRLSTIVARHADRSRPFIVSIARPGQAIMPADDTVVLRGEWRRTLVPRGATVVITYVPMGGGGGGGSRGGQGKAIGGALAMIALAVVAPYAIGALGGVFGSIGALTTVGKIAAAGIVMGGGYLISKATQAKANKQTDNSEPLYGVSGGGNLPQPGGRIPVGYGRFWSQPDLSQPDYIINDGEDQVLYKRLTLGLGEYDVEEIRVGDAVLWTVAGGISSTFAGAEIQIINPGGTSSLVPGSVLSSSSVAGAEVARTSGNPAISGPYPVTPTGVTTKRIQIDWSLPYGCYMGWKKDGRQLPIAYEVKFEYAPIDGNDNPTGAWQLLRHATAVLNTTRAQRFTAFNDVPEGRYAVRAYNTQPENFFDAYGENRLYNDVTWDGLRSVNQETITRPHVTEIAIRIRSGKTLAATTFSDIWVRATRRLPVWTGSAWVTQPTRKSVWAWADIMRSSYGGNLLDGQIDVNRALHYAGTLTALDTFDGIIRGPVSVHEAASTVLGVIRADPVRIGNTWSIGRDEPRAVAKHLFTRRQIVRDSSQAHFQVSRDDGQADVIVEYYQDGDPRRRREVRATFGAASLTPRRYAATGVSTYEHAHHLATWMAAAAYYRRERRTITVEHEGRLVSRGDPARVDVWYMADAVAAGVMAQDGYAITLDTDVAAAGKYAIFRSHRNREWGPVSVSQGANAHTIVLHAADVAAAEASSGTSLAHICDDKGGDMPSVLIGPLTELQDAYIIDSATPQGRDRVTIEAVRDSDAVWTAIGQPVPPEPNIPSRGDMDAPSVPIIPWLRAAPIQKTNSLDMEWAVGVARGAVRYVVSMSYDDGATWETVSDGPATSGTYTLRYVDGMAAKIAAFAVSEAGVQGPTIYATFDTYMPIIDVTVGPDSVDWDALSAEIQYQISLISRSGQDIYQQWVTDYFAGIEFPKFDWSTAQRGSLAELERRVTEATERLAAAGATTAEREYTRTELIKVELAKGDLDNWAAIETEKTARISQDEALAQVTTTLGSRLTTAEGTLSGQATAINGLSTRVTETEGGITAVSERVDMLQSEVTGGFSPVIGWNFRKDLEGWTGSPSIGHDINGGNLYFTKNSVSANVYVGNLSFQAGQAPMLKIRYRRATGTAATGPSRIRFKSSVQSDEWHSGNWVALPAAPNTNWITATVQMADAANWQGTISLIMFIGSDGVAATDQFVIDFIEIGGPGANVSSSALDKLTTSVETNGSSITAVSSRVTTLESKVNDPVTGLTAQATAHKTLKTRVSTAEGSIVAEGQRTTLLENKVNDPTTGLNALGSAYSALGTRVTATEGTIASTSNRVTALENTAGTTWVAEKGWSFTAGLEGWTGHASIGHDANGGNLYYTKNATSSSVYVTGFSFKAARAPTLKIRFRRVSGTGSAQSSIRFKSSVQPSEWDAGSVIKLPAAPNTDWIEATVDMAPAWNWTGDISLVMFVGSEGSGTTAQFAIDYIQLGSIGVAASASALDELETTVTQNGNDITSMSSSITSLTNTVNHPTTGVAATASGLSSLTTTVGNQGSTIGSQSSAITALQNTVNNPTTGVSATASGLSNLTTRVTNAEGNITSVATRVSSLEAKGDSLFVTEKGWSFNAGLEGWTSNGTIGHDINNGYLYYTKTSTSSYAQIGGQSFKAGQAPTLKIRYRRASGTGSGVSRIRFRSSVQSNEYDAGSVITLPSAPTTDWIEATVDMTVAWNWTGDISLVMFFGSDGSGSNAQFVVDYILFGKTGIAASAGAVSQVEAKVTETDGKVTSQASQISTLQAGVNGNTGSITALQNVVSGPNGLTGQYGIVLDFGQGINGGFTVVGARKLDGSGYVETRFRGDMFVDGTITAPKIITNQIVIQNSVQMGGSTVVTNTIGANAVSNTGGFYQMKYIDEVSDAVAFNVRPGAKVLVWAQYVIQNYSRGTGVPPGGTLRIKMNEAAQTEFNAVCRITQNDVNTDSLSVDSFAIISPNTSPSDMWRWFGLEITGAVRIANLPVGRYMLSVLELAR